MVKFWKYRDRDEYQRQKAGDILKRNPLPEPLPERAPRPPVAPLGPQPAPAQPRPSLLRPSTWPTATGIPTGAGLVKTPWMQTLMGAVGGPEAAQRAEPAVAWQRWLSSLTRERVAQPLAGELTRGGPLRAVFDPGERQALAANWRDVLAGRRTYGEVVGERAATARQAWQEAPVPGVARAATETLLDPLGVGGAMVAAPLMGAGGLAGALGKAYMAVDIADMAAYVASATPEELAGVALLIGGVKVIGLAGKTIAVGVPALRRLLADEVGAVELLGRDPEGAKRALASDVQELSVDQINIDPRKYQKRAIGKEGIGYREERVKQILREWDPALMTPVKVRRMPDGSFDLLGGHHRMEVFRRKGITTVMAQIFDVDTPQAMHIAEIDNALTQGYEPSEWASIVRGRADEGMSVGEIASTFGFKRPTIAQQYLSLSYLPDGLLQAVDIGLLPERVAVALGEGAQKYNIGPSTLQQLWLREIKPSPREWTATDVRTLFERIAPRAQALEEQMEMFGELPGMEGQRDSLLTAMREMKSQVKELKLRKTRLAGVEREIAKDRRAGKTISPRLAQAAGLLRQEIDAADAALRQIEQGQLDRVMAQARPEAPAEPARPPLEMRPEEVRPTARLERPTFLTPEEARPVFGREGLPRRVPEAAPEAMRPMEVPPEEAGRLAREAQEAAGQRRLGAPVPTEPWRVTGYMGTTPVEWGKGEARIYYVRGGIDAEGRPLGRFFSAGVGDERARFPTMEEAQAWAEEEMARLAAPAPAPEAPELGPRSMDEIREDLRTYRQSLERARRQGWSEQRKGQVQSRLAEFEVEEALAQGKPIQDWWRQEYPDLIARYARPEAPPVRATGYDLSHPAADESYWGEVVARLVDDPRNITQEEWTRLDPVYDYLSEAHPDLASDYWDGARAVAEAIAINEGRIVTGPVGTAPGVRRAEARASRYQAAQVRRAPVTRPVPPGVAPLAEPAARFMPGVEPPRYYETGARGMNPRMLETLRAARDAARRIGTVGELVADPTLRARFADILDVEVWASPWFRQTGLLGETQWDLEGVLEGGEPKVRIYLSPRAPETTIIDELAHAQGYRRGAEPGGEAFRRAVAHAEPGQAPYGEAVPEVPGYYPRAEPAVPPPAGPAVPPVTAQPVPGARGIAGPPLAPGAGAAVPMGQGVLPGIGQPVTAPPQPPVAAPPAGAPPAPPTQPQFGTVGPTPPGRWLPNLKNTDEILREHYRPDWARRFTDWAERGSQVMARIMHFVGIPERSHAAKIRILWSEVVGDLYAAAEGAMARVRRLGSERSLFDVVEGQAHIAGRAVAVGDVLEHIDDYPVSGVQRQYAETMHKIYDDAAAVAEAEGIEVNKLSFADGGHYVGRRTMGRRLPDGTVVEAATITGGPTKRWVGGRAPFEKAREFATEQEALDAGYEYLDFVDAQTANLRSLARRVANERVEQYVLANIPARVAKKARLGEVALPGPSFRGRWFLPGDVKGVREYLEGTDYSIPRKAADVIRSLSRLPRLMLTAFDLGPAFIQLQAMGFSYPKQWAKAVWHGFEALLSERRYYEIMTQHADTITRWTPDGLIISRVGGTEWTEFLTRPGPILKRVPGLMRAARAPARMFDATLNFARILGIEATENMAKTDLERVELARFWNLFTGVVDPSRQGLTETQQAVEAAALFAPRYTRAVFGIMADIAHGGLRGKMARESLAKVAVSGLATYIGLCAALNQKPELDPRKRGTWLTIGLAGQRVGIGGGFYGATRVLGQIVTDPENAPEHAARFLKGKLSPAVRSGMAALTRQDFLGRALDTPWKLTKELIVGNFTPIWLQGTIEAGKDWRALTAVTAAEIVGLRTFPESPATRRTKLREQYAEQQFGRAWADLHRGEKYELETTVPSLAAVTEEARGLAKERRSPWAMYRYDLEQMREPVRTEIASLTKQFEAGLMDGNTYREEIQSRQMMSARMGDFLRNMDRYKGLEYAEQEPKNAVDRFIDSYYQVAEVLTDPRTGYADAAQIVRQRDWLIQETSPTVVSQGMRYINRNLDPKYIEARDLMREYQRIPQYIGMGDEQAQAANEAMRKYTAMRRANPMISPEVTRSLLAQQDPRAVVLMEMAYSRRNPARRYFWAMHPLLSVFYSDLTEEEVEMVAPMSQVQSQEGRLPAWAMQGGGA